MRDPYPATPKGFQLYLRLVCYGTHSERVWHAPGVLRVGYLTDLHGRGSTLCCMSEHRYYRRINYVWGVGGVRLFHKNIVLGRE